jgi:hypothetical protein
MKLYAEKEQYKLYKGSMLNMLEVIEPNTIDSIITDPPYELNFMNKGWDRSGIAFQKETWEKCYEVLKPGGYLLAFGGSRTFHRIACAIEDAGFEIRDTIMWLYGEGFPKSMNIGLAIDKKNGVDNRTGNIVKGVGTKDKISFGNGHNNQYEERTVQNKWQGWGTALKPSYEPIIVARKPVEGTVVNNVLKWGVGGINIDECRVGFADKKDKEKNNKSIESYRNIKTSCENSWKNSSPLAKANPQNEAGRFPANVIHDGSEEAIKDMPNTRSGGSCNQSIRTEDYEATSYKFGGKGNIDIESSDGSASRYFYCAKASKKDRDEGLDIETEEYVLKENINEDIKNNIKRLLNL